MEQTRRRTGVFRKLMAQFAVLGLVAGGAVFALSASVGATSTGTHQKCTSDNVAEDDDNLEVCKTGPVTATPGTDITYTISASTGHNDQDSDDGFVVTDPLPDGTTLVDTSGSGWDCSASTDTNVECSIGGPDPLSVGDITVTVHVADSLAGKTIENCATLAFIEDFQDDDRTTGEVTACVTTDVVDVSDLAITKTALSSTATANRDMSYTVTVTNLGPQASGSVSITDTIPTGTTLVGAGGGGWSCVGLTTLNCDHAGLADGESASMTVVVNVGASLVGLPLKNCAEIVGGDTSDVTSNNSSCATISSVGVAPLAVVAAAKFTG